ncbi:MAG: phosphoglycolate phosphatase [Rhodocyclaceae bacterium]|jgi:phosphoglycolate phosphatase|nr:phosphoglycolate phosphatase [Rhodocyclaceae bacterium]
MPLAVKAVLLDLDGTLLDTVLDLHAAANGMLADLGRPPVAVEDIRAYVGRGIPNLVKRVLAGHLEAADDPTPPPAEALASFRKHYAHFNGRATRPFPGVMEGLEALKAMHLPMGVITNKAKDFTLPLIARTGLAPYFDVTVAGDMLPKPKPDPMPLVWACGRLGVSPADTLMVGDSVHDFKAGRAAGCYVFLVPYGYNEGQDVRTLAADAIVGSLLEAAQRLSS